MGAATYNLKLKPSTPHQTLGPFDAGEDDDAAEVRLVNIGPAQPVAAPQDAAPAMAAAAAVRAAAAAGACVQAQPAAQEYGEA